MPSPAHAQSTIRSAAVFAVLLLLAGCAGDTEHAAGREGAAAQTPRWTVENAPVTTVGGATDDLTRVHDVVRLGDGRLVVANGGEELRFYSATGQLLRVQGRAGRGPGEYVALRDLARVAGDTVLAFDGIERRASVIDPAGTFVRGASVGGMGAFMLGVLSDGSIIVGPRARQWTPTGPNTESSIYDYELVGPADRAPRVLASAQGAEHFLIHFPDGGRGQRDLPFAAEPQAAVQGDRFYLTDARRYAIDAYAPDGRVLRRIELPREPGAVTSTDLDGWRDARLAAMRGNPNAQRRFETMYAEMPKPSAFPAIGALVADETGLLWVQDYPRDPSVPAGWTVFDSTGAIVATAATPGGLRVRRIGADHVVGILTDADDVERVVVLPLRRGAAGATPP